MTKEREDITFYFKVNIIIFKLIIQFYKFNMILGELSSCLDKVFCKNLAMSWDKAGLQIGNLESEVRRILVTLNVTDAVADEAASLGAGLIVAHHPLMFNSIDTILSSRTGEKEILKLVERGIAVYAAHTNYDSMEGGLNDFLASKLGLIDLEVIDKQYEQQDEVENGSGERGIGRCGRLAGSMTFNEFAAEIKDVFKIDSFTWMRKEEGDPGEVKVGRVAVAGGSANSLTDKLADMDCDVIVVGEIDYHNALKVIEGGRILVAVGHGNSEKIAVEGISAILKNYFEENNIEVDVLKSSKGDKSWRYHIG